VYRIRNFLLLPLLLGCAGVVLTVSLAHWQARRAAEKELLQQQMAQAQQAQPLVFDGRAANDGALEWRRVSLHGQFLHERTVYLDNRVRNGVVGFYVLTPFQLEDGVTRIMINRGWIARDVHQVGATPRHGSQAGSIVIEGVLRKDIGQTLQLSLGSSSPLGPIRQTFSLVAYQTETGMQLSPWIVYQLDRSQVPALEHDGLLRDWQLPVLGVEKHRAYMFQWYAMACAIALGALVWQWKLLFRRKTE